jgi:excisionase family DNA binding protein
MNDEVEIKERLASVPRLLTLKQAGVELGVPIWSLRRAIWKGELPQVRIGRGIRIDRKDLEAWLTRVKIRGPEL